MATSRRIERINKTLMKEIGEAITLELKDPRITSMASVVDVQMSPDMKYCKVEISVYGANEVENVKTFDALQSASGYVSSLVSKNLRLRYAPEIRFERTDSIARGVEMYFKLKELSKDEPGN
jgi:ribosome-binding factor A